jgi:hypothetical protein
MQMEVQLRIKENIKVFNKTFTYNTRVIKNTVESQHISLFGERDNICFFFFKIKLHMIVAHQFFAELISDSMRKQLSIEKTG